MRALKLILTGILCSYGIGLLLFGLLYFLAYFTCKFGPIFLPFFLLTFVGSLVGFSKYLDTERS